MISTAIATVSNGGVLLKVGASVYGFPVVVWALGASEGAVRTAFNAIACLFEKLMRHDPEAHQRWEKLLRDGGITISCTVFAGISLIPVIGTTIGTYNIGVQCHRFNQLKRADERALQAREKANVNEVLTEIHRVEHPGESDLNLLSARLLNPAKIKGPIALLPQDRNLPRSLIKHYYGYSIAYVGAEKTCHGIHVAAVKIKDIAVHLFKYGFVRRMAQVAFESTILEVGETLDLTANNRKAHQIFSKQKGN